MSAPTNTSEATCLLVDDHPGMREGMRLLLESEAFSVVAEAPSGERALELIRSLRPDVALVDITLSTELDGLQTTLRAREEELPTRVVIYSANGSSKQVRQAFDSGAFGFVHKMSPYRTLLDSLHAAAIGDRFVDPAVAAEWINPSRPMLTRREGEVLERLARGMQNDGIAHEMSLSAETIKSHVSNVFSKLETNTRAGAVARGFRSGLLV